MGEVGTKVTRILAMGPLPPPIGGTRVLFQVLVEGIKDRSDVDLRVISLPPVRTNKIRAAAQLVGQVVDLIRYTPQSDVVALHCGPGALPVRASIVSPIARLFGKPLVIRTFGGDRLREDSGPTPSDKILRAALRADLYLGETLEQIEEARSEGDTRVEWFPNSRPMPPIEKSQIADGRQCRRFVFISHVKKTKGILELIEAAERFGDDVQVDVYGPFREGMTEDVFKGCRRVSYRGVIPPDNVLDVLRQYDAVLLPTYHLGEGYPGIIIEAYAVALPVICTRWRRLPELVDKRSGILVEPKNAEALFNAMKLLVDDHVYYARLREGAMERRKNFDSEVWNDRFVQFCKEAVITHRARRKRTG